MLGLNVSVGTALPEPARVGGRVENPFADDRLLYVQNQPVLKAEVLRLPANRGGPERAFFHAAPRPPVRFVAWETPPDPRQGPVCFLTTQAHNSLPAVDRNQHAVANPLSSSSGSNHAWDAVLPRRNGGVSQNPSRIRHDRARSGEEYGPWLRGRPAHKNIPRHQLVRLGQIANDPGRAGCPSSACRHPPDLALRRFARATSASTADGRECSNGSMASQTE